MTDNPVIQIHTFLLAETVKMRAKCQVDLFLQSILIDFCSTISLPRFHEKKVVLMSQKNDDLYLAQSFLKKRQLPSLQNGSDYSVFL